MTDDTTQPASDVHDAMINYLIEEYRAAFKDERGVHVETLLSALGALAGFGCQMAIREALIATGQVTQEEAFTVVTGNDGHTYYFGDFLNEPLLSAQEGRVSVWSLAGGAAESLGAQIPDIVAIVEHYAEKVGGESFFETSLPDRHTPRQRPIEALKAYWPGVRKIMDDYGVEPLFYGWTPALAAQRLILQTKDILDPGMAAQVIMDAAVPMSKIDPAKI